MTWLNLIAVLCAGSAWLVTRRAPQHRPVAVALSLCAVLDIIRAALSLSARVDLALCLVAPAVSAWLYMTAFGGLGALFPASCCWIAGVIAAGARWDAGVPVAYIFSLGLTACTFAWAKPSPWTVTQRTAAMLLVGDVAGLILLCRREWISYQAGAVLALVTGYQVWWLWRLKRDL